MCAMKNLYFTSAYFALNIAIFSGDVMAKESAGLPQLDPTWYPSQIFWLFVVFGTLYFLLVNTVLPQISLTLENRHSRIQNDIESAEKERQKAEEIHLDYERIISEARLKSNNIYKDLDASLNLADAKETESFNARYQAEVKKTEQRIENSKREALEHMTSIAAEMASQAAHKIVGISTDLDKATVIVKDLSAKAKAA